MHEDRGLVKQESQQEVSRLMAELEALENENKESKESNVELTQHNATMRKRLGELTKNMDVLLAELIVLGPLRVWLRSQLLSTASVIATPQHSFPKFVRPKVNIWGEDIEEGVLT